MGPMVGRRNGPQSLGWFLQPNPCSSGVLGTWRRRKTEDVVSQGASTAARALTSFVNAPTGDLEQLRGAWTTKRTAIGASRLRSGREFHRCEDDARSWPPHTPLAPPSRGPIYRRIPIGGGIISHSTRPIHVQISALHLETIVLYISVSTRYAVILSLPWLALHNPQVSWMDKQITQWYPYCLHNFLRGPTVAIHSGGSPAGVYTTLHVSRVDWLLLC
ncbi:hypothetical protein AMELA_G00086990 [Ameiurus melas]|uniref:Uncharacterized protein n=1 Tax=Ameiurus melas TaxID=219545 RepID=A0A7J6AVF6_AMEME|nr:hypothetical protein AMELA_G00086990 [Ameiurus melas]